MFKLFKKGMAYWYAQYNAVGKVWLTLAIVALSVDAAISYQYGVTQTTWHGIGFALVAVFFSLVPDQAYSEFEAGRKGSGTSLACAAAILGMVALYSHLGYGAGVRVGDIQQTAAQNAKYTGKQETTKDLDAKSKTLVARRDALDREMAALVSMKVGTWSVAVLPTSAAELDGQIEAKQLEAANEAKRNGCKSKCEARTNELAHLRALRAKAEQIEKNEADYADTVQALTNARDAAGNVEFKSSSVANQTSVAAQLYKAFFTKTSAEEAINPSPVEMTFANLFITGGGSLAFMIMAPLGFFIAGRNRRPGALSFEDIMGGVGAENNPVSQLKPGNTFQRNIVVHDERAIAKLSRAVEAMRNVGAPQGVAA